VQVHLPALLENSLHGRVKVDFFEPAAVNQVGEPVMPLLTTEVTLERTVLVPAERPGPRRATFALVQRDKATCPLEGAAFP